MRSVFVLLGLVALALAQNSVTYTFGQFDSTNLNQLQLNGETPSLNPNGNNWLRITSNEGGADGSAFFLNSIPLIGDNGFQASFSTFFGFKMPNPGGISDEDGVGADGIVFTINAVTNIVGVSGGGIGYQGIPNSIGIEFDSWDNGLPIDINGNHVGIDTDGNLQSIISVGYPYRFNDGNTRYAWVDYNGESQTLEVRISENSNRPASPILSKNINLVAIFGTPHVYVGFTAASGSAWEDHYITSWIFSNTYAPIVAVCGNGVVESGEQCDGGACCSSACTFSSSSTVCRASAGVCDVPEYCSGSSITCPSNSFGPSSLVCRPSVSVCDVSESCTGNSAGCPTNSFSPSGTVCRASAGVCDVTEVCDGTDANCPDNSYAPSTQVCRASAGQCDPSEDCQGESPYCPSDVNGGFETACNGLNFVANNGESYSFTNFDVISFNDFRATSGDVEGRVAAKNNIIVSQWSVGAALHEYASDLTLPFSLVAGGDVNFTSGEIYPNGLGNQQYPGAVEEGSYGGVFNGADYLAARMVQSGVTADWSALQTCYSGFQNNLAQPADNVNKVIQWSGLYLTCQSGFSTTYYLTLTNTDMSQYTWVNIDLSCNAQASWVVNIPGGDDVTFQGGSFPVAANQVTYNILGTGRTVFISNYEVNGAILAPYNYINEPSGVIVGRVIAADFQASHQVNHNDCFFPSAQPGPSK